MSENNSTNAAPAAESQVASDNTTSAETLENTEADESEENEALEADATADTKAEKEKPLTKTEKKRLKSLKLKIDGKEYDEELPFEIDEDQAEYMKKHLQMSRVSQKRMAESAKMQKDVEEFVNLLKTNPEAVLSDPSIGIDLKKFAAKIIEQEIENSKKSPEQVEREKLEKELKALREEREKEKESSQKKDLERLQQQEYERYDILMTQALEKSDLPKSPYVVKKMADIMLLGLENGVDVLPQDVLPLVREEIVSDLRDMFAVMPEDVIESIVGSDKINKIRKRKVAQSKQPIAQTTTANQIKDIGTSGKKDAPKEEKKISVGDWLKS